MTKQRIGAELKRLRTVQGLTQAQVGKASGQSTQHIYAMETGTLNLTLDRLEKVAQALGVTITLAPVEKSMLITEPEQKACLSDRGTFNSFGLQNGDQQAAEKACLISNEDDSEFRFSEPFDSTSWDI